ncbi:hypothetical protein MARPO_2726s0001, partial [Marchantia polymorpha]
MIFLSGGSSAVQLRFESGILNPIWVRGVCQLHAELIAVSAVERSNDRTIETSMACCVERGMKFDPKERAA